MFDEVRFATVSSKAIQYMCEYGFPSGVGTLTRGRIVAIKINFGISPLLIVGTYWPSGSSASALDARVVMQKKVAGIIKITTITSTWS